MEGIKMASSDVQKELAVLGEIAKHHSKTIDKLLVFQDKQLILQEKQIYQDEKIDNICETLSTVKSDQVKMNNKITENHTSIKIFGGVATTLITIFTIACQIYKLIP